MSLGDPVKTEDGSYTIMHPGHGECYHSYDGAAKEARDLYIERSGFLDAVSRTTKAIRVLDVGLGLAYNALTTVDAWRTLGNPSNIEMLSLEIEEKLVIELASGKPSWSEGWADEWKDLASSLEKIEDPQSIDRLKDKFSFAKSFWHAKLKKGESSFDWLIVIGDASKASGFKTDEEQPWDFVWQDPFSPEKNPSMWSAKWFSLVKKECHKETSLMTYSVSRVTKNALTEGGWGFEKVDTTTRKRHWIKASPS